MRQQLTRMFSLSELSPILELYPFKRKKVCKDQVLKQSDFCQVAITAFTDRLLWFSVACFWCQSFDDVSPYVCSYYF